MQGMCFAVLDKNGTVINHGIIAREITPENYLCQFQQPPVVSRVVSIEELRGFNLFNSHAQRGNFLEAIAKEKEETPESKPSED